MTDPSRDGDQQHRRSAIAAERVEAAKRYRAAGFLDDAKRVLDQAAAMDPAIPDIWRELETLSSMKEWKLKRRSPSPLVVPFASALLSFLLLGVLGAWVSNIYWQHQLRVTELAGLQNRKLQNEIALATAFSEVSSTVRHIQHLLQEQNRQQQRIKISKRQLFTVHGREYQMVWEQYRHELDRLEKLANDAEIAFDGARLSTARMQQSYAEAMQLFCGVNFDQHAREFEAAWGTVVPINTKTDVTALQHAMDQLITDMYEQGTQLCAQRSKPAGSHAGSSGTAVSRWRWGPLKDGPAHTVAPSVKER